MIEFALSFLLFITITVVGIMDLGRGVWVFNVVSHAAHVGARYAMVRGGDSPSPATVESVRTYVKQHAYMLGNDLTVNTTWDPNNEPGNRVQIQVNYSFVPLTPFLPTIPVAAVSKMVIAN